ncbi:MAG: hypothetical protein AAF696_28280 [Bacteroidota bacterium]
MKYRLETSLEAAHDVETILNILDTQGGRPAVNQWTNNWLYFREKIINYHLASRPSIQTSEGEIFVFRPRSWNYEFFYTVENDLIRNIAIRKYR